MNEGMSLKIGAKLTLLRNQKGMTQEAIANVLGVSNKTISKWETGLSVPEAEYIVLLADYFEVSIDEIFGRTNSTKSINDSIAKEFDGLSHAESAKKSFELAFKVIRESIWRIGAYTTFEKVVPDHIISDNEDAYRAMISSDIGYEMFINSPYTNLAVMLFQNECDFSWLEDSAKDFTSLFQLLADVDGIKIVKLMYTKDFIPMFTADYIAKELDIDVEKVEVLLNLGVKAKICRMTEVDLRDGNTMLYDWQCDGMVLAILNLAFEVVCGRKSNEYAYGGEVQMIRGKAQ